MATALQVHGLLCLRSILNFEANTMPVRANPAALVVEASVAASTPGVLRNPSTEGEPGGLAVQRRWSPDWRFTARHRAELSALCRRFRPNLLSEGSAPSVHLTRAVSDRTSHPMRSELRSSRGQYPRVLKSLHEQLLSRCSTPAGAKSHPCGFRTTSSSRPRPTTSRMPDIAGRAGHR